MGVLRRLRRAGAVVAVLIAVSGYGNADDSPSTDSEKDRRPEVIRELAEKHTIVVPGKPDAPCELRQHPLITFTNPTRADLIGGVFLWTHKKRPMAIGGLYLYSLKTGNELGREFQSLTESPVRGELNGELFWNSKNAGVKFQVVRDSKPPSASATIRLRQMKRIANEFTVQISRRNVPPEQMRMLAQPLYRYDDADSKLIDGALFAFAQGTDPEALLLVEARSTEKGAEWRFAIARCTAWAVAANRDDQRVFDGPFYDFKHDPTASFLILKRLKLE